ncbi:hypothetical protein [Mesorhizobium sp.]|uniref:hypothetical protein n=1 Tax=Mesorhizobium sp. TaxID=1871066 RepID=UPI0011FEE9C1|nr:hypothetical protein [Mesorhizobium sp.]TIO79427.1 MAG: hypothetical protein E5X75_02400 [Mesorhizobium sp.]
MDKNVRGILIPGAPIVLKRGRHSIRGGFGVRHIWARHQTEILARGYSAEEDIAKYVADIVRPGSPVFCEFGHIRNVRVTVVRTTIGIAVLEHKTHGDDVHYSVVTAFAQRNAHGTRVGTVLAHHPAAAQLPENETPTEPT